LQPQQYFAAATVLSLWQPNKLNLHSSLPLPPTLQVQNHNTPLPP
jgi:hypothetical protein